MKKFLLILTVLCGVVLSGNARNNNVPKEAYDWYPKYVTFLPEEQLDSVLAYADTDIVPIIFKVNEIEFEVNPQLVEITDLINNILSDDRVNLAYVWIGGSASPDGPLKPNIRLGENRAKALHGYITRHTSLPDDMIRIENLEEDWESIVKKILKSDISCKDKVLEIIRTE